MGFFDQLYISVYLRAKASFPKKAKQFARRYVSILQIGILLLFGVFVFKFSKQMKLHVMDSTSFYMLFVGTSGFILFKNWMNYNGKKHNILWSNSSKRSPRPYSLIHLISFPVLIFALSVILARVP